jgi:cytochrome c biogenesis protein CcdA
MARSRSLVLPSLLRYWWVLYFVVCLGFGIHSWGEILASPMTPDPITGHVVPYNNHGKIVYITRSDSRAMVWEPCIGPILALILFLIQQRRIKSNA